MNRSNLLFVIFFVLAGSSIARPQSSARPATPLAASASTAVPALVPFSGVAVDAAGKPLGEAGSITFQVFKDEHGGEPLWAETQTVALDLAGRYTVRLGASSANGIPTDLFQTGEARWLEVQIAGQAPGARILLVSVPYAMKAADAATLGGLPASAFARAWVEGRTAGMSPQDASAGTSNFVPKFSGVSSFVNSQIFDNGANVGIGTATPTAKLHVNGKAQISGSLTVTGGASVGGQLALPPVGTATASFGQPSQSLLLVSSAFNSATQAAVSPRYEWVVDPQLNNTASPTAILNLFSSTTSAIPTPTGLYINSNGFIHFAPGQIFPGASGTGTITGVKAGTGLIGGGTTGGVTLSLDTTKVPLLVGNNAFTGALSTTAGVNAGSYSLNGTLFSYGGVNGNAFLGFAGSGGEGTGGSNTAAGTSSMSSLTSGTSNSALGFASLHYDTTGSSNTAMGALALEFNAGGNNNTAFGGAALVNNRSGSQNTAIGEGAGPDSASPGLVRATAVGANAAVSQNDSLVLGQTTAGSPGASYVNVGVGTATPATTMEIAVNAEDKLGPTLTLSNPGGTSGAPGYHPAAASIDFKTYLHASTAHTPTSRIEAIDENYGNLLSFFTKEYGSDSNTLQDVMDLDADSNGGEVSIQNHLSVQNDNPYIGTSQPVVATITGNVWVYGNLDADNITSAVDHPIDPANKYLVHSSVGSSEMLNIYSGNATTDELGLATVELPDWFEAENTDFRYQLTTIGRDAHAWVAEEVANHRFKIATNASGIKVSWQITGVRQDAYAKAHPLVAERDKPENERGFYVHPELYGQPAERQMEWARSPRRMQRMKARREASKVQTDAGATRPAEPAR